jgi:4-hydroxythreonine-4-phosphate dehydrogenase
MIKCQRILITPGEPAGIGPDLVIQIAQSTMDTELIVLADPHLLKERAKKLKLPLEIIDCDLAKPPVSQQAKSLKVIPITLKAPCVPGTLNPENAAYVIQCLQQAADICLQQKAHALVTGPIQKSIINAAGIAFTGHTEFLAQYCKIPQPLMLFVTPKMKVAIATTHIPLAKIPQAITPMLLINSLRILNEGLINLFHIQQPKILVSGLNPHAGESGHLGTEEIEIIAPVIKQLQSENMNIIGPLSADTIYLQPADAIFAMYHDQALPVVKYSGFNEAVNVTLGLPFLRTSVDHGTALDLAGTGQADIGSFRAAIQLANIIINRVPRQ